MLEFRWMQILGVFCGAKLNKRMLSSTPPPNLETNANIYESAYQSMSDNKPILNF
jgi:hypothetical protein